MAAAPGGGATGAPAPDFELESHEGVRVRLSGYRGAGSVTLFFMRAYTCLTCIVHAVQLGLVAPRLTALDSALLVLVPGPLDQARKIAKLVRASFPVLADPDRVAYRAFGFQRRLLFMQQSGVALVDRAGRIAYLHRSTSPRRALDLDRLLAAADAARTT